MRILHCISKLGAGGAGTALRNLMAEQQRSGHEIQWIAFGGDLGDYESEKYPIPGVIDFSFSRKDWRGKVTAMNFIREKLLEFDPEIVHSHLWPTTRLIEKTLEKTDLLHIVHVQDTLPWLFGTDWRSRWQRHVTQKLLSRRGDKVRLIAVSEATARATAKALKRDIRDFKVVHNALARESVTLLGRIASRRSYVDENSLTLKIGTAGRLTRSKGHNELIEAVAALKVEGFRVDLSIAGEGGDHVFLQELGKSAGLGEVLVGQVSDIGHFLSDLDIFVLPSLSSEGLSLAQLEAMASGLPVVVTDVAGAKEAVEHGKDGLIVAAGDVSALKSSLERLCRDPKLRLSLGRAGASRIQQEFVADRMASAVDAVYQSVKYSSA